MFVTKIATVAMLIATLLSVYAECDVYFLLIIHHGPYNRWSFIF